MTSERQEPSLKYWFIVNPVSGKGKFAAQICAKIEEYASQHAFSYEICETLCRGDATRIAQKICTENPAADTVIFACGGDGLVSEVASGVADFPGVTMGVIPAGTGNDFVRSFTFPKQFASIEAQLGGKTVPIDAIHYTGDNGLDAYSLNVLNMGFDCHVVACTDRAKKIPLVRAGFAYKVGVAMAAVTKPGLVGELSVDGGPFEPFDLMFLLAANGRFYGGGYCPAPYALMDDGKIDLCTVKNVSRTTLVRLIGTYRNGTFLTRPDVIRRKIATYRRCERLTVRFPKATAVCGDGEISDTVTLHAEICPKKIRFLLPKGCALPAYVASEETDLIPYRKDAPKTETEQETV
jgi:YegS/Rv2252/BmrU family lipid kinase